jgi:hypothetical protein
MNSDQFYRKYIAGEMPINKFKPIIKRLVPISYMIITLLMVPNCESNERFYRPNLPENLCTIGIIDADDTIRYISFEKSFQAEYPEEVNDSLRNFSFTISSSNQEVFNYKNNQTVKNLLGFKLPDSIKFTTGQKYFLTASETSTLAISAETKVPEPPSQLTLISVDKEIITTQEKLECTKLTTSKSAIIKLSFSNDINEKKYYALLLQGTGTSFSSAFMPSSGLLDFDVRETNSPGFFAKMTGLVMYHYMCDDNYLSIVKSPVNGYFIDGSKISDKTFNITLSTQFSDTYCVYDFFKAFRVKLLSIPEELYLFEKSLYTYDQTVDDPFSEPVYLNGNIKGGNGVFAICRSSTLSINLYTWY